MTHSLTEAQLVTWFFQLGAIHGELLPYRIEPAERVRRGCLLVSMGPSLVAATADGIAAEPHLFPDAPASGPELHAAQRTAFAWLHLRNRLQAMARLADDAYLSAQTRLTGVTMPFVRKALDQAHPAGLAAADIPRRNLALVPALLLLHGHFKDRQQAQAKNKALRAASAAAAIAAPTSTAPAAKSKKQERADADRRAAARSALSSAFTSLLRSRRDAKLLRGP